MTNIFVGNLSYGAAESDIRSLFEQYGTVERASLVTDRETGQARGFGFVEMPNDDEAERAIAALNGRELNGRALTVNIARPGRNALRFVAPGAAAGRPVVVRVGLAANRAGNNFWQRAGYLPGPLLKPPSRPQTLLETWPYRARRQSSRASLC
jgi:RNA recognition motif-containing protein